MSPDFWGGLHGDVCFRGSARTLASSATGRSATGRSATGRS